MISTLVHVWVKEEFLEPFIEITKKNHEHSIKEPGNVRFDITQDMANPCKFTFIEVYKDDAAIAAHKTTDHYHEWRNTVQDWMAQPRQGIKYQVLFPAN